MKIRQYAYFALLSEFMPASEITGQLGIEPDRILVRGSRRSEPPIPKSHMWEIVSENADYRVDEHINALVSRLAPYAEEIGSLALHLEELSSDDKKAGSVLRIIRHLGDDEKGVEEDAGIVELPNGEQLERLGGQHQLLGWFVDRTVIDFLVATRASLDVDEYG